LKSIQRKNSICFITVSHPIYGLGGAEIQSYIYAKEFSRQGWEVFFLSQEGEKKGEFDNIGIKLIKYCKPKNAISHNFKLIILLFKIRPNVIFYRFHRYQIFTIVIIAKLIGARVIWSIMSDNRCGRVASTIESRENMKIKIRRRLSAYYLCKYYLQDLLFYVGIKNVLFIIAQNKYQQNVVEKAFKKKSSILYSGVPIPEYNATRKNQVVFIATMKYMKNPEIFCEISKKFNRKDIQFILIGENYSEPKLAKRLENLIKESDVIYLGKQNYPFVGKILSESKVLVNCSDFEGFPNTFILSWVHGTPVVSLKVDPDNLIKNEKLGCICEGNIDQMIKYINDITSNLSLWQNCSTHIYNYSKHKFNITNSVKNLISIIRSNYC